MGLFLYRFYRQKENILCDYFFKISFDFYALNVRRKKTLFLVIILNITAHT